MPGDRLGGRVGLGGWHRYSERTRSLWIFLAGALIGSLLMFIDASSREASCRKSVNDVFFSEDVTSNNARAPRATIHVASVACSKNKTAVNLAVLLKSMLIHFDPADHDLHIHAFSDIDCRISVQDPDLFTTLGAAPYVSFSEHDVHDVGISDEYLNLFRPCAGARLSFPHIDVFKDVDKLLYFDSDMLLMQDAALLWRYFDEFSPQQHSAMTLENYRIHELSNYLHPQLALQPCPDNNKHCLKYYGRTGLNSGTYLMHLARMRDIKLFDALLEIVRGPQKEHPRRFHSGDQDVLNYYFEGHPDELLVLPCEWNYRTDSACPFRPALLHGNRGIFHQTQSHLWSATWRAYNELPYHALLDAAVVRKHRGEVTDKLPAIPEPWSGCHFCNESADAVLDPVWLWDKENGG